MASRKRKQPSGGAKMKAAGKRAVLLGLDPDMHEAIRKLAAADLRSVTSWIIYTVHQAIQQATKKGGKNERGLPK
jgi:hypothetical protein